jgi:hypothetical protein
MRARFLLLSTALAALLLLPAVRHAPAAPQAVALFPLELLGEEKEPGLAARVGKELAEKLSDRFDVTFVDSAVGADPLLRKRRARGLGAGYMLTGSLTRIGRSVALDLTLAPMEGAGGSRTVVATASDDRPAAKTPTGETSGDLPFAYRRLAIEATARLKLLFFGDGKVGEGAARRTIPGLAGTVTRSRNIPGEVMSVARGDTDGDGTIDVVAAYPDAIAVYRQEGGDLREKARIPEAGRGLFHVDAADLNRNGSAEIVAVRYVEGQALSDVWEHDGKDYRKIASDIPAFLRALDMGKEGVALVAQRSDPAEVFAGPVFRVAADRIGQGGAMEQGAPLPLPPGTFLYSFFTLRHGEATRFAAVGPAGRPVLLDESGNKLWEGIDTVHAAPTALDAAVASAADPDGAPLFRTKYVPGRVLGADLDGNGSDEVVVVNNIISAGGFFENVRIASNAEVLCFAQTGEILELAWRTPQVGAAALDAFLDPSPDGRGFRVGIAARDPGKILGGLGEWRLFWVE